MAAPLETEKITSNLGVVDLGQIDLLVQEGFYANRTDFIRTAIRNQIAAHADAVKQSVARNTLRSEEHTSELQSRQYLVCRLLLEKKNTYHGADKRWRRSLPSRRSSSLA